MHLRASARWRVVRQAQCWFLMTVPAARSISIRVALTKLYWRARPNVLGNYMRYRRLRKTTPIPAETPERRGRGRPKLGVVSREVTLLPRHWEWLAAQPGGASVALRKLVEQARRDNADKDRSRRASERAYHFISAMGGDFPGFEEATRALFAGDLAGFAERTAVWPEDVRDHALRLADENA